MDNTPTDLDIFCNTKLPLDKKINKVQERALRILYDNDTLTFLELLEMDGAFTVHQRNIQILLLEMFKAKNNLEPSLLKGIFQGNEYRGPVLRSSKVFMRPSVRTQKYGERSLQNLGVILWNQLPNDVQNENSLQKFKMFIKNWKATNFPCELCINYVKGLSKVNCK